MGWCIHGISLIRKLQFWQTKIFFQLLVSVAQNFLKENIVTGGLAKFNVALNLQKTYYGKLLGSWISLAMQIHSVNSGLCRTIVCIICFLDFGSFKCSARDLYGILVLNNSSKVQKYPRDYHSDYMILCAQSSVAWKQKI